MSALQCFSGHPVWSIPTQLGEAVLWEQPWTVGAGWGWGQFLLWKTLLIEEAMHLSLTQIDFFGIDYYLPAKNLSLLSPCPYWTARSYPCYETFALIPFLWFLRIMPRTTMQRILICIFTFLAGYLDQTLSQREAADIFMHIFFWCIVQHKSACVSSSSVMLQQWCEALSVFEILASLPTTPFFLQL